MLYYDYTWDITQDSILFDEELSTEKLGWKEGDMFKLTVDSTGRITLIRIDPVEKFVRGHE